MLEVWDFGILTFKENKTKQTNKQTKEQPNKHMTCSVSQDMSTTL